MLKMAYLPEKANSEINKELTRVYITVDYLCFINELMFCLKYHPEITQRFSQKVLLIINKILLDNVFRHIVNKSANVFLYQVSNHTFSKDLYINPFYTNQILEDGLFNDEDKYELESVVTKRLSYFIDKIYTENIDTIEPCLTDFYNYLNQFFHYINVSYFKFEILAGYKPLLMYAEDERKLCDSYE